MEQDEQKLRDLLGSAKRVGAPDGFVASVTQRLALEEQQVETTWFGKVRDYYLRPSSLSWAVATGAAAVLCALLVLNSHDPASSDQTGGLAVSEIDDQVLLDMACKSLGDEELQSALYQMAAVDAKPMADPELAEILFNS